jgi:hypothetical protein
LTITGIGDRSIATSLVARTGCPTGPVTKLNRPHLQASCRHASDEAFATSLVTKTGSPNGPSPNNMVAAKHTSGGVVATSPSPRKDKATRLSPYNPLTRLSPSCHATGLSQMNKIATRHSPARQQVIERPTTRRSTTVFWSNQAAKQAPPGASSESLSCHSTRPLPPQRNGP